ncbi:zf-HC2 domain-containing protein [bacterium]|nr:zf-HC2 domain-containing protein [bacterium]
MHHHKVGTEQILRYLRGELDDDQMVSLEMHLATCDECLQYMEDQRQELAVRSFAYENRHLGQAVFARSRGTDLKVTIRKAAEAAEKIESKLRETLSRLLDGFGMQSAFPAVARVRDVSSTQQDRAIELLEGGFPVEFIRDSDNASFSVMLDPGTQTVSLGFKGDLKRILTKLEIRSGSGEVIEEVDVSPSGTFDFSLELIEADVTLLWHLQ